MRTITCDNEAASWSRNIHILLTRLLPSSDDSHNNVSRPLKNKAEIMVNQALLDHWNTTVSET
jgi:hypothetical protein